MVAPVVASATAVDKPFMLKYYSLRLKTRLVGGLGWAEEEHVYIQAVFPLSMRLNEYRGIDSSGKHGARFLPTRGPCGVAKSLPHAMRRDSREQRPLLLRVERGSANKIPGWRRACGGNAKRAGMRPGGLGGRRLRCINWWMNRSGTDRPLWSGGLAMG